MPTNILLLRTNFRYKPLWLARGYKMELSEIEKKVQHYVNDVFVMYCIGKLVIEIGFTTI